MRDRLLVHGLRLFGRHGVLPAEKSLGQQFVIDVDVYTCTRRAGKSDDFAHTLNYVKVFEAAQRVVQGPSCDLVEHVAQRVADDVLRELADAQSVRVCVKKPHVALPAVLDYVGVEIWRDRGDEDAR